MGDCRDIVRIDEAFRHIWLFSGMGTIGTRWLTMTLELLLAVGAARAWGYRVEEFEESLGLYYTDKGMVNLYSTMWKTSIYIDLKAEELEVDSLGSYINHVDRLCNSAEVMNWMGCNQFRESVSDHFRHLQNNGSLLMDTVKKRYEDSRLRQGLINFVGEINKVLFGTSDENDIHYYYEQFRKFERNSDDTTDLLKQQVYVINP